MSISTELFKLVPVCEENAVIGRFGPGHIKSRSIRNIRPAGLADPFKRARGTCLLRSGCGLHSQRKCCLSSLHSSS
jgi:hypothetical protein